MDCPMRMIFLSFFVALLFVWSSVAGAAPDDGSSPVAVTDDFEQAFNDDFDEPALILITDPLEIVNRGTFWLNDKLYFYALKPVARVWRVVPRDGRQVVKNFFTNLSSPLRILNAGLQLKPAGVGQALSRFLINSTFGIAGLFDVAGKWGITKVDEDFGQTLGRYGVGSGFYLVLPLLGPSSLRDLGGAVVDDFVLPGNLVDLRLSLAEQVALRGGLAINDLSLDRDSYEKLKRDSLDPYLFLRASYAQYRTAKIQK